MLAPDKGPSEQHEAGSACKKMIEATFIDVRKEDTIANICKTRLRVLSGVSRTGNKSCREKESDENRIKQRLKQIQFGKNTLGYENYTNAIKKREREKGNPMHPHTPDAFRLRSKKNFDACLRSWRRALHLWDAKVTYTIPCMFHICCLFTSFIL